MPAPAIRFDEVRAWIFGKALPLWAGPGLDRERGGSVETLDFAGRDGGKPFKRTRVQARQVYAFSHGHLMGWEGPGLAAADHCWRFMQANARRDDGAWMRLLGPAGGQLDPAADAYDTAFALYALAWRLKCGDGDAMAEAHATMDTLDELMAVGPGLGWFAAEDDPTRQLNPHMHLLEAFVALAEAGGEARFADLAGDVQRLFRDRMFEPGTGALAESYDADWSPMRGPTRQVWPGHLYEWCWLLHEARRVTGLDLTGEAAALYDLAEKRGLDADTRLADDALAGDELVPSRSFRIWPQTEALKAQLAMFEHQGRDTRARIAEVTDQLLDRYLAVEPAGAWCDRFGPGFQPIAKDIPASILYHVLLAFSELLRLEPQLSKAASPG